MSFKANLFGPRSIQVGPAALRNALAANYMTKDAVKSSSDINVGSKQAERRRFRSTAEGQYDFSSIQMAIIVTFVLFIIAMYVRSS